MNKGHLVKHFKLKSLCRFFLAKVTLMMSECSSFILYDFDRIFNL